MCGEFKEPSPEATERQEGSSSKVRGMRSHGVEISVEDGVGEGKKQSRLRWIHQLLST